MAARLRRIIDTGDRGASAVEYGLLVAGIAAVIVAVVFAFGGFISNVFNDTCSAIDQTATDPGCIVPVDNALVDQRIGTVPAV